MATFDLETLNLTDSKRSTPAWLKKAAKNVGSCAHCKTQYMKSELNAQKHCRHCADELGETHILNS